MLAGSQFCQLEQDREADAQAVNSAQEEGRKAAAFEFMICVLMELRDGHIQGDATTPTTYNRLYELKINENPDSTRTAENYSRVVATPES